MYGYRLGYPYICSYRVAKKPRLFPVPEAGKIFGGQPACLVSDRKRKTSPSHFIVI